MGNSKLVKELDNLLKLGKEAKVAQMKLSDLGKKYLIELLELHCIPSYEEVLNYLKVDKPGKYYLVYTQGQYVRLGEFSCTEGGAVERKVIAGCDYISDPSTDLSSFTRHMLEKMRPEDVEVIKQKPQKRLDEYRQLISCFKAANS